MTPRPTRWSPRRRRPARSGSTDWRPEDFAELRSRFGVGGALTTEGVLAEAEALNEKRRLIDRARVVLETSEAPLLASLVNLLYERVTGELGDRGKQEQLKNDLRDIPSGSPLKPSVLFQRGDLE